MADNVNRIAPDLPSTQAVQDRNARAVLDALCTRSDLATRRHPGTQPAQTVPSTATLAQLIDAFNAFVRSQQI